MSADVDVTEHFSRRRARLHAIAHRMLGSTGDADDAVQETWLRLHRTGAERIDNLDAWLTTVLSRVCLNALRARTTRVDEPWERAQVPDPVVTAPQEDGPEDRAVLGDAVGRALFVVLDVLDPDERLAFVLHDLFAVPFDRIAPLIERSTGATRQLASRARRKVGDRDPARDVDRGRHRAVVDAFLAAAHAGDLDRLVAIMHPDVVLRSDGGPRRRSASAVVRGADAVAEGTRTYRELAPLTHPVLVNGSPGVLVLVAGAIFSVMEFVVINGRIAAIDVLADPDRLAELPLPSPSVPTTSDRRAGRDVSARRAAHPR